jgi:hypothetical protein
MQKTTIVVNQSDRAFWDKLQRHPQLRERMEKILALAESPEHLGQKADQIEDLLIQEVRRLGAQTMQDWAQGVERAIGEEMKDKKPSTYCGKKNE